MSTPQQLAEQFLDHFNSRNHDGLLDLVDADVRYNGRHGEGEGVHLLQEWIGRATTTITPMRWFGNDDIVVAEVDVEWKHPASDTVSDRATWGISFSITGDRITSIARYADIGEAVTKMGLLEEDAIPELGFPQSSAG